MIDGNEMYMKYTLVTIQPSRVDFQWLLLDVADVITITELLHVSSSSAAAAAAFVRLKGFFFKQHFDIRSCFVQPQAGTRGTQRNQYTQLSMHMHKGSMAAMDRVA